jgi:hypothetical protein
MEDKKVQWLIAVTDSRLEGSYLSWSFAYSEEEALDNIRKKLSEFPLYGSADLYQINIVGAQTLGQFLERVDQDQSTGFWAIGVTDDDEIYKDVSAGAENFLKEIEDAEGED